MLIRQVRLRADGPGLGDCAHRADTAREADTARGTAGSIGSVGSHGWTRPVNLRITDGMIAEIGADLPRRSGEEVLDGGGAFAIPGLWDQHIHSSQLAQAHSRLDTTGAGSASAILSLVQAELERRRETGRRQGEALVAFGHRLVDLVVPPTVPMLDAVTGDLPTVLIGGDAHHAWINTAALRMLGAPPRDGIVGEDEWFNLVPLVPSLPGVGAQVATGMAMMQRQALDRGVVGVVDMEWGRVWETWQRLGSSLRVRTGIYTEDLDHLPAPTGTVLDAPGPGGSPDQGLVEMGPLKVILDGALGSHTAYTREAYGGGHGPAGHGTLTWDPPELVEALRRARRLGLTAAVHAIGDAAAGVALEAIARSGIPARLEHAQMLTDQDVQRMAHLGVGASMQPAHLLDDRDPTEELWHDRTSQAYRFRDLLEVGVEVSFGSDAPVAPLDPWLAMAAAVHRSADEREGWLPRQQLQPREALAASTDGVAALAVGGRGDVVLLEQDVFGDVPVGADGVMIDAAAREAAHRLRENRVMATVVAGRIAAG